MAIKKDAANARAYLEELIGPLSFGRFLRVWREKNDLTQVETANKLRVSRATLCDIEKGRQLVSVQLARRIAKTLGAAESVAIECSLQDQLNKAKVGKWRVKLVA